MTQILTNQSVSGKVWRLKDCDERLSAAIAQRHGVPDIIARLLASRGVPLEGVDAFLAPSLKAALVDPDHLLDMDKATARVHQALLAQEPIVIFGDYDVDGATSSALLYRYFSQLGGNARFYIPDRVVEGYGPNAPALRQLQSEGARLIITVDCGTTSHAPLEAAAEAGLDMIVLDHHAGEPKLPPAVAVVNPNRMDQTSPYGHMAAVGVSFLFAVSLNRRLRDAGFFKDRTEPDLRQFLDLVALGSVCDVMPLTGVNRAFVALGLRTLGARQNLGLKTLCDTAGILEKPTAYHLGFLLGPRINAGGRIGKSDLGARLLTTSDSFEAQRIADELNALNAERQEIEKGVLEEATALAEAQTGMSLVVAGDGWHQGVIGIVAGRLKESFHRPTIVISFDETGVGKGSGRSIPGVDLGALVHAAKQSGLLLAGGGHPMAAGLSIAREKLDEFRAFLEARLQSLSLELTPSITVDAPLAFSAITTGFLKQIAALEPYGQGNASPRFVVSHVRLIEARIVGTDHVRCILSSLDGGRITAMAFRAGETDMGRILLQERKRMLTVVGTLKLDSWQGVERVQMMIEDIAFQDALPLQQAG